MMDVHNLAQSLGTCCGADDVVAILNQLGLPRLMPCRQTLQPGWSACCSGHYNLELGLQVPHLLAVLLVQVAETQVRQVPAAQVGQETAKVVGLGTAQVVGRATKQADSSPMLHFAGTQVHSMC